MCAILSRFALLRYGRSLLRGERKNPPLLGLLWLCSQLFRSLSSLRHVLYRRALLPIHKMERARVVSIGNLVAGGTGKTPLVQLLAETLAASWRIAILTRGYGGWQGIGDEALLLARRLPEVKIYSGKNRVALARRAEAEGCRLLFVDDGFQHRALARDIDCLLLHTEDLRSPQHYLPRGYLRDSPRRISEADFLFLYPILSAEEALFWEGRFPQAIGLRLVCKKIVGLQGQEMFSLQGKRVGVFSGIARPHFFREEVQRLGGEIVSVMELGDHEPIREARFHAWAERCRALGAEMLVCTEKDWVKLYSERSKTMNLANAHASGFVDCKLARSPNAQFWTAPSSSSLSSCPLPLLYLEATMELVFGFPMWQKLIEKIEEKLNGCT